MANSLQEYLSEFASTIEQLDLQIQLATKLRKAKLQEAEQRAREAAISLDNEERLELFREFYWNNLEVPANFILKGLGYASVNQIDLGEWPTERRCAQCFDTIYATSKSNFNEMLKNPDQSTSCRKCRDNLRQENQRFFDQRWKARQERQDELRQMPYHEYLATPEWQEKRKTALKRARYHCQVCNASECRLDVHHNTYERRGNELVRDLVVLCRDCHETFHDIVQ